MPEFMEIFIFVKMLLQIIGWELVGFEKFKPKARCDSAIEYLKSSLECKSLIVNDILSQGKEIAIIFTSGAAIKFSMGQGAGFYVGKVEDKSKSPLDYRTNMIFKFSNDTAVFVVDCHNFQNQVVIEWKTPQDWIFDINKGPDLYDDALKLEEHILRMMVMYPKYFEEVTLQAALLNQSLFNGLGAYSSSETSLLFRLRTNCRPWRRFKDIVQMGLLKTLIEIIQRYFREMEKFIDKYIEDAGCMVYNEKRWLDFRSLFVRVYRQPSISIVEGRQPIVKLEFPTKKNLAAKMKIGCYKGSCYLPQRDYDVALKPNDWKEVPNNPFRPGEIGVGAFNWWGATEMIKTLKTPEKDSISLRQRTHEALSCGSSPLKSALRPCSSPAEVSTLQSLSNVEDSRQIDTPRAQDPITTLPQAEPQARSPKKRKNQRQRRSLKIIETIFN